MSTSASANADPIESLSVDRVSLAAADRNHNTSTIAKNHASGFLTELDIAKIVA